jgi:hypothetical protein
MEQVMAQLMGLWHRCEGQAAEPVPYNGHDEITNTNPSLSLSQSKGDRLLYRLVFQSKGDRLLYRLVFRPSLPTFWATAKMEYCVNQYFIFHYIEYN